MTSRRRLGLLEGSGVAACAALAVPIMARLATAPLEGAGILVFTLAVVAGYLAADLVSGVVHWLCDQFFEEDTPLIGRVLIRPFREHHRDPLAMTRHGFLELAGNSCLGLVPVLALASLASPGVAGDAFVVSFGVGAALTNHLHKWSHALHAPALVRSLQRWRLVLTPDGHRRHHGAGYAAAYCVTTGWLNPLIDRLRVFDRLGAGLGALGVPRTSARD